MPGARALPRCWPRRPAASSGTSRRATAAPSAGSIAHADAAAELPLVPARRSAGRVVVAGSARAPRRSPPSDLFVTHLTTVARAGRDAGRGALPARPRRLGRRASRRSRRATATTAIAHRRLRAACADGGVVVEARLGRRRGRPTAPVRPAGGRGGARRRRRSTTSGTPRPPRRRARPSTPATACTRRPTTAATSSACCCSAPPAARPSAVAEAA